MASAGGIQHVAAHTHELPFLALAGPLALASLVLHALLGWELLRIPECTAGMADNTPETAVSAADSGSWAGNIAAEKVVQFPHSSRSS